MRKLSSKRTILNLVSVLVFAVLISLLGLSSYIINVTNTSGERLESSIEAQNRQHARSFLLYLNDKLSQDVDKKTLDISNDKQIEKWARNNIRTVKSDSTYDNLAVIKVEYSKENDEFIGKYIWSASPQAVSNNLGYKTTLDLIIDQAPAKKYFKKDVNLSNQTLISFDDIKQSPMYNEHTVKDLIKQKIIRYKNPETVQEVLDAFYEGSISGNIDNYTLIDNDNKKYLVEWTTVPLEASIGISKEPKTEKGTINTKYTRLVIASTIDQEYITKPFEKQFDEFEDLKTLIHIAIVVFVALSIGLVLYFTWIVFYNNSTKKEE